MIQLYVLILQKLLKKAMQQLSIIVLLVVSSLFCINLNAQEVSSPPEQNDYILILNSNSYENAWSTGLSKLIRYEIEEQEPELLVSISYAGVTNRSSFLAGRYGMQAAFANGRVNQETSIPSVLILIGDESWMYYRIMNLHGVWDKVPVLLVGVNSEIMDDFSKFHSSKAISDDLLIPLKDSKKNLPVTAIMDKENEAYTVWLMKQLMPDLNQIVFLSSSGYQDEFALRVLEKTIAVQYPELKLKVIRTDEKKVADMQHELSNLPENTAVLLGSVKAPEGVSVPIFQLNDREMNDNTVVGGYYPLKETYAEEAANIALRIHQGESPNSIPFSYISGEIPYLNKLAVDHFKFGRVAEQVSDVAYTNVPVPFIEKHVRPILLLSLTAVILIFILFLNLREKRYRGSIVKSMEKYKKIYDEYQIVYENMPMGLVFFDKKGNVLNRNLSSDLFFDKVPLEEKGEFNLFQTKMIDDQSKNKIEKKLLVNKVFEYGDCSLRLIFRNILDEESDSENILMIMLDYTSIQNEKVAKERIYKIFNFAMDASSLGVAEYNLVDNNRFATDAWYKNLCIDKDVPYSEVYRSLVDEDRKKVEYFLKNIGEEGEVYFADTVRVKDGNKIHWLQYVIQLLEYGPEEGRVIVAELALNVDSQIYNESELDKALQKAKESDRLKNAFVANMSSDIRPALDELVVLSNRLIETSDGIEKESLMARIEQNNDMLLRYVDRIIDLSRTGAIKQKSV